MKIILTQYEKQALEHSKQYEGWEQQIIAKDSYIKAYKQAIEDIKYFGIDIIGTNLFEVEFKDGEHQLVKK